MNCKVATGLNEICEPAVGGLDKTFWAGYLSELSTSISQTQAADISELDFTATGYLRRFTAAKNAHAFGVDLVVESKRRKHWLITFNPKIVAASVDDDVTVQNLTGRKDLFFIVQNNNRQFFVLGASNGMRARAMEQSTGTQVNSDVSEVMTFVGIERSKPLRFNAGTYQGTLTQLELYEEVESQRDVLQTLSGFDILTLSGEQILILR